MNTTLIITLGILITSTMPSGKVKRIALLLQSTLALINVALVIAGVL